MKAIVRVDGASRGNPGLASCAAVITMEGEPDRAYGIYLGECTNNEAEYCGLILGLEEAKSLGAKEISVFSDSQLCVRQLLGEYKVKSENLIPFHRKALRLLKGFKAAQIQHVPREKNVLADRMSNRVLDLKKLADK